MKVLKVIIAVGLAFALVLFLAFQFFVDPLWLKARGERQDPQGLESEKFLTLIQKWNSVVEREQKARSDKLSVARRLLECGKEYRQEFEKSGKAVFLELSRYFFAKAIELAFVGNGADSAQITEQAKAGMAGVDSLLKERGLSQPPAKMTLSDRREMQIYEVNFRAKQAVFYKANRGKYPMAFSGDFINLFNGALTNQFTDKEELPVVRVVDNMPVDNKELVHKLAPGQFEYVVTKDGSSFRLFCADENGDIVRVPRQPDEYLVLSGN